jgi:NAD(P)-dependent dehydrogenase (short-subunit alcohol dehydrogenase family)
MQRRDRQWGGTLHQDTAINKWDEIMETNLRSFFFAAKAGDPTMKKGERRKDHQHRLHDLRLWNLCLNTH